MNIGLMVGASGAAATQRASNSVDIVLPDAKKQGLTDSNGKGAAVEISLSPEAVSRMTIDMQSLAAKGYSEVDIDTDGKPGAEIVIQVDPSKGNVPADAADSSASDVKAKATDMLLELLFNSDGSNQTSSSDSTLQNTQSMAIQIALRAYNATHAANASSSSSSGKTEDSKTTSSSST